MNTEFCRYEEVPAFFSAVGVSSLPKGSAACVLPFLTLGFSRASIADENTDYASRVLVFPLLLALPFDPWQSQIFIALLSLEEFSGMFSHEEVYTRIERKIKVFWSNKRNRGLRLTRLRNTRIMWQTRLGVKPNE